MTLATSELVADVVLHARTAMTLALTVGHGVVQATVTDHDPRPPVPRPIRVDLLADLGHPARVGRPGRRTRPAVGRTSSRRGASPPAAGLLSIDAIADEWGVLQRSTGKDVVVPASRTDLVAC